MSADLVPGHPLSYRLCEVFISLWSGTHKEKRASTYPRRKTQGLASLKYVPRPDIVPVTWINSRSLADV